MKKAAFITLLIMLTALSCLQVTIAPPTAPTADQASPAQEPATPPAQNKSLTPFIVSFDASAYQIDAGATVTLSWEVTGADAVSIDQGVGTVPFKGTLTLTPRTTATYLLTASNSHGSSTSRIQVNVKGTIPETKPASFNLPEVVEFRAEPANIIFGTEKEAVLTWEVRNSFDVVIDPGLRIIRPKGSAIVKPAFTTTYKLTAINDQGSIIAATTVTVSGANLDEAPVIEFLTVDRYVIKKGETAVLSWKTREASSVSIDKGVGIVSGEGTTRVSPTETTIYMLTATNPRGAQFQTVAVNVK